MSVDFFDCEVCGESVCECDDFERCECGRKWCSLECAQADGYKEEHCKLGYEDNNDCEQECWECESNQERSCKYCREDDFEDAELLKFFMKKTGLTREDLIEEYKISKGGL